MIDHDHYAREFMRLCAQSQNRRSSVESLLWDVASGRRGPIEADEARELAIKLGVPAEWMDARDKAKFGP